MPAEDELDEGIEAREHPLEADVGRVDAIVANAALAGWVRPAAPIAFGNVPWRPDLVHGSGRVFHVHLAPEVPRYIRRRMIAAREAGHLVTVALEHHHLFKAQVVRALADVDAYVQIIDDEDNLSTPPRHHLAAMADMGVPALPDVRREVATLAWERRAEGAAHIKGRRLEALLAFLLAQTSDLRIYKRNFRGDTDEIDIIVQVDAHSDAVWREDGVPFIFCESKNRDELAGAPQVKVLMQHLQERNDRARIGIFCSAEGFTGDATKEVLKFAYTPFTIVLMGPKGIVEWINADDPDQYLREFVSDAMVD